MEPFDTWRQDPEFNNLPDVEKADMCLHFFDNHMVDDEFRGLPDIEQKNIKSNFLDSLDLKYEPIIPTKVRRRRYGVELDIPFTDYSLGVFPEGERIGEVIPPETGGLGNALKQYKIKGRI